MKAPKLNISKKELIYLKLAVWTAILTWMVAMLVITIPWSLTLRAFIFKVYGEDLLGSIMAFVFPSWMVFTVLLVIWLMAKWAGRKLS